MAACRGLKRWARAHALRWYASQLQRKALLALQDRILLRQARAQLLRLAWGRTRLRRLCCAFAWW